MPNGKELEQAVAPVVAAILAGTDLGARKFKIEPNKIVRPQGVPMEIDLFVTDETNGEVSVFECKNTRRSVSPSIVMLLKRKMELVGAIHGYVVGLTFTRHARKQAALDGIALLDAKKHAISPVQLVAFNAYAKSVTICEVLGPAGPIPATMRSTAVCGSTEQHFGNVLVDFARRAVAERSIQPDVQALPFGENEIACFSTFQIPNGALLVDGTPVVSLSIECPGVFTKSAPAIRYGYDVAEGHIVAKFERFQVSENQWADTVTMSPIR